MYLFSETELTIGHVQQRVVQITKKGIGEPMKKKMLPVLLLLVLMASMIAACGGNNNNSNEQAAPSDQGENNQKTEDIEEKEQVTLRFFSNSPNLEDAHFSKIMDMYMDENPHVKIEYEGLQDEPYKNKIKVYSASNDLPDVIQVWGQPSFLEPLLEADDLLELNLDDYKDYQFAPNSLDGFTYNGNLYGLPRNAELFVLYYNKKIFEDNGLTPPTTTSELFDVAKKLRENGINPLVTNGRDGWSLPIWFEYFVQRETGTFETMDKALSREMKFTDEPFLKAAEKLYEFSKLGGLADGTIMADYGTARNMFGQGQAAMYLMGSWEAALDQDENFPDEFTQNVGVIPYPASDDGTGGLNDIAAWYGGGFSVTKHSKHPEEAVKFLNYLMHPDNWAKILWEENGGLPATNFEKYMTGNETQLMKDLVKMFNEMEASSGTPVLDMATPEFKDVIMKAHQKLISDQYGPQEFLQEIDAAAEKAAQE